MNCLLYDEKCWLSQTTVCGVTYTDHLIIEQANLTHQLLLSNEFDPH